MRVLTTVYGKPGGFWGDHTTLVGSAKPGPFVRTWLGPKWAGRVAELGAAFRLFAGRGRCRAVVTGGGLDGLAFAWLQRLWPWNRRRHVLVDCNWYRPANPLIRWLQRLRIRGAAKTVAAFVVWASHEVDDYAREFGLPRELFHYVPFHPTLAGYDYQVRDEGYLFAGGNYDRDYPTLVEAVRSLDVPVWLATTRPEQLAGTELPSHVVLRGTTEAGFRSAMAGARLVVVPMQGGLLHSGGQQTLLNAMVMGKPVIAVGRPWASDFLTDGEDGLIVDYGDVAGLRRAIARLLDHPGEARRMALRGRERAATFSTRRCMETVYRLALGESAPRTGSDRKGSRHDGPVLAAPAMEISLPAS
jgi:glycosyltransferase involved in cell wall biosynthesis